MATEPRAYRKDEIMDILQKTGRVKNASRRSLAFGGWEERFMEWYMTLRHLFTTILNTRMLDFAIAKSKDGTDMEWNGLHRSPRENLWPFPASLDLIRGYAFSCELMG